MIHYRALFDWLAGLTGAIIFTAIALLAFVLMVWRPKSAAQRKLEEEEAPVIPGTLKRCGRCQREVDRLRPYISGRTEHHVCVMCAAEMDLKVVRLTVPRD